MNDSAEADEYLATVEKMAEIRREEKIRASSGQSYGGNLLRQHQFHLAAQYVAMGLCSFPEVRRIVLFGSVALPLQKEKPHHSSDRRAHLPWVWHECSDIDIAVWVDDLTVLNKLQRARGQALNFLMATHNIGVAHHQVELSIMEPRSNKYLGHLCIYGICPKDKPDCYTPGCGEIPFLQIIEEFAMKAEVLRPSSSICLYDAEKYPFLRESILLPLVKG